MAYYDDRLNRMKIKKPMPEVLSIEETIQLIVNNNGSISRFGDGEFSLCFDKSIHFQKKSKSLRKKLRQILVEKENNQCLVCIPDIYVKLETDYSIKYWYENIIPISKLIKTKNSIYGNANVFRAFNLDQLAAIQMIWHRRNVIFVVGKDSRFIFDPELFIGITANKFVYAKAENAWADYDDILNRIIEESSCYGDAVLVLISLGPTATVLAYDLAKKGIQSIDIGHITNIYHRLLNNGCKPENIRTVKNE